VRAFLEPKWGIRIVALTALIFAIPALVNLLILMSVRPSDNGAGTQLQLWIIFALTTCFCLVFVASAYGLWQQQNWGRVLFLWTIVMWCGFNLFAIFAPDFLFPSARQYTLNELAVNSIRFSLPLLIPLWYLNRPSIKAHFHYNTSENSATQETRL
jgi:hypothetical protein